MALASGPVTVSTSTISSTVSVHPIRLNRLAQSEGLTRMSPGAAAQNGPRPGDNNYTSCPKQWFGGLQCLPSWAPYSVICPRHIGDSQHTLRYLTHPPWNLGAFSVLIQLSTFGLGLADMWVQWSKISLSLVDGNCRCR